MKHTHRCRTCGRLHGLDDCGDATHPFSCRVCGGGVVFHSRAVALAQELARPDLSQERRNAIADEMARSAGTISRTLHSENWEVLADASPERLQELGLTADDVTAPPAFPKANDTDAGRHIVAKAEDGVGAVVSVE